jgi:hypothetical protein
VVFVREATTSARFSNHRISGQSAVYEQNGDGRKPQTSSSVAVPTNTRPLESSRQNRDLLSID